MFSFGEQLETDVFLWFNWTFVCHMEQMLFAFPNIYGNYAYAMISKNRELSRRKRDLSHMV